MQFKLDENLRTEQISRIEPINVISQNALTLKKGDFIMAVVEQIKGDKLTLRAADGALIRASSQGDMSFVKGDVIDAAVGKTGGKYFLYILNVSHESAESNSGFAERMVAQQTLSDMMSILKRNPAMDTEAARFLAQNNIQDTVENIATLAQLTGGKGLGELLGQIIDLIAQDNMASPDSLPAAGSELLPQQDINLSQNATSESELTEVVNSQKHVLQSDTTIKSEKGQEASATRGEPVQPKESKIQGGVQNSLKNPAAHIDKQTAQELKSYETNKQTMQASNDKPEAFSNDITKNLSNETHKAPQIASDSIVDTLKGLFVNIDGLTGEKVRKNASDQPMMLNLLKSELEQSDIKNKELYLKNTQQSQEQLELADKSIRYEFLQLPLAVKEGEHQTAELYIFRRRENQTSNSKAGLSILIALDTKNIGRVETLIREDDGKISVEFRMEQTDRVNSFKRNSAMLTKAVESAGYRLSNIRFAGLEKKTTILNANETVFSETSKVSSGIDVKI